MTREVIKRTFRAIAAEAEESDEVTEAMIAMFVLGLFFGAVVFGSAVAIIMAMTAQ